MGEVGTEGGARPGPDTRLPDGGLYSIGDVAALTGIGTETIRIWERRYGRPRPMRLGSGHRRYTAGEVRWLQRVAAALAAGHRPSEVLGLDDAAVSALLSPAETGPVRTGRAEIDTILTLSREFAGPDLRATLRCAWTELGPRRFLFELVAPLLERVGTEWVAGRFDIRYEHFLSEILEDELRTLRAALREDEAAATIAFATLTGERHGLGLQLAAFVAALTGARVRILGTNLPVEQIAEAAAESHAQALAVSVSLATGGVETDRALAALRGALPSEVRLVVGGRGARGIRRGPRGLEYVGSLAEFETWMAQLGRAGTTAAG